MTINVQLQPLTPVVAGQARLIIKKWQGELEGLEFSVQRNQAPSYLQAAKQWANSAAWFAITLTENAEGDLEGLIGDDILDPILESSGTAAYIWHLQAGADGERDQGRLILASGLLASAAGSGSAALGRQTETITQPTISKPKPIVEPTVEPVLPPEELTPSAEPLLVAEQKKKKGVNPLLIILPIVTLLLIAAVAAWLFLKPSLGDSAEVNQIDDTGCSIAGLESQSELNFVQNCIQEGLSSEQLLTVITDAKAAGKCGVAQRLYANRAQSGDTEIALAYAKEYDPQFHLPNACFSEPDKATASYWYETVLSVEPDHALAQQRLGELE